MEDAIFESDVAGRQYRHNSIFSQTGVTFIRWGKRLTEIGQIIIVPSEMAVHITTLARVQVWPSSKEKNILKKQKSK